MLNKTRQHMVICAAALISASIPAQPTIAAENTITLKAIDGSHSITGTHISYDDGIYAIDTKIGPLLILASLFECQGAACPTSK